MHNEKNVIHRDLKPLNIMLTDSEDANSVKIIDFGFAVKFNDKNLQEFSRCGTVLYQPPEQAKKIYAYSKTADPWATGVIAY